MRASVGRYTKLSSTGKSKVEFTDQRMYWRNAMHVYIYWAKEHVYWDYYYNIETKWEANYLYQQ